MVEQDLVQAWPHSLVASAPDLTCEVKVFTLQCRAQALPHQVPRGLESLGAPL